MTLVKVGQAAAAFYQVQFLDAAESLDAILQLRCGGTISHRLREHDLERPFPAQVFRASWT
jgi:hypothetical protein